MPDDRLPRARLDTLAMVAGGARSVAAIAEQYDVTRSTASSHLQAAYEDDHLDRERDPDDRRRNRYTLTDEGRAALKRDLEWLLTTSGARPGGGDG